MNPIHVRAARPEDAETIAAYNAAMAEETEGKALVPQTVRAGVRRVLGDAGLGRYYVAEVDGRVIGQMMITHEFSDWRDGLFWWIQSVYVHADGRGRGVYRALHEHVLAAARAAPGVCGLRLYVDERNTRAQEVYRRLGMVRTGYAMYEVEF